MITLAYASNDTLPPFCALIDCLLTIPRPVLEIRTPVAKASSSYFNSGRRQERVLQFTIHP